MGTRHTHLIPYHLDSEKTKDNIAILHSLIANVPYVVGKSSCGTPRFNIGLHRINILKIIQELNLLNINNDLCPIRYQYNDIFMYGAK